RPARERQDRESTMTSTPTFRPASPSTEWKGEDLLGALTFATKWLDHHRDRVNALNVFPIPDGDTGTNMALTMNASLEAARKADEHTSELQSRENLVCRLLLEKKKNTQADTTMHA